MVDDVQFLKNLKGKRVKLTLRTSSYYGVIQRINLNKTLVLADVVGGSNGCKYPGSKLFFGHEIINVEFIDETNSGTGNIVDHRFEERLNVEEFQPYRKTITLGEDDDDDEYINFEVIDEFHEKFGSAVMHIKKQHVISIGADGVEVFKNGRLCWLQIATKNKVYLFDILSLGTRAFKNGLSMILENKHILKITHDCRAIAGCLISQFGVMLTNIFDTQVADFMCFSSETGGLLPERLCTLEEVVSLYLKVPSSQLLSLKMKSQLTKEEGEMWSTRPCPIPLLKVMALSVIHLQPLRLVLLDMLLTDYIALVDSFLNSRHYEPDDLEIVNIESVLELPRELRQLDQTRCERQKWATDHYHVTEQGLLARFKPRKSSQADPVLHKPPRSPPRVDSVSSVHPSAGPETQAPIPDATSDLSNLMCANSLLPLGRGRGCSEALRGTVGRGRLLGKDQSSITALPAMGRGFLLQLPQDQIPSESQPHTCARSAAPTCPQ